MSSGTAQCDGAAHGIAAGAPAGQCAAPEPRSLPLTALPGFGLLALASVTLILLLICLPPLHKASRRLFMPTVLFHVERGLSWVVLAQRNQRRLLTTLCSLSCFTVSISFYITFLPLLIWGGEAQLGARLVTLMCCCEYVGNGVKDLVCAPRPMGHPRGAGKTRLLLSATSGQDDANVHSLEYGLPSSHTMHSLCLNFYLAHFLLLRGGVPGPWALAAYAAAALWVAWIGFSRVYMGMHTPIDIGGGAVIAIMVLASYLAVDERYEAWAMGSPSAFWVQLAVSALFLRLHPLPLQHTPSYENSVIFAGVALGCLAGLPLAHGAAGLPTVSLAGQFASPLGLLRLARRLAVGGLLAGLARELGKRAAFALLTRLYAGFPLGLRRLWRPPIHSLQPEHALSRRGVPVNADGVPWDVLTTSRFVSYACLGFAVQGGSVWVFRTCGW